MPAIALVDTVQTSRCAWPVIRLQRDAAKCRVDVKFQEIRHCSNLLTGEQTTMLDCAALLLWGACSCKALAIAYRWSTVCVRMLSFFALMLKFGVQRRL